MRFWSERSRFGHGIENEGLPVFPTDAKEVEVFYTLLQFLCGRFPS